MINEAQFYAFFFFFFSTLEDRRQYTWRKCMLDWKTGGVGGWDGVNKEFSNQKGAKSGKG